MRDHVGLRERVIGAICLVLTIGIVGAFVLYARQPRAPFFSVPPEMQIAAVVPEIRHALSLLPDQPAPGWQLDAAGPEVYSGEAMARPLGEPADYLTGAGVKRLFQGRYLDREDTRRQLTVRVFELEGPAQAKKLSDAKRPRDAVGEPLGRGGWRGGDGSVGFWGGRYFTHVFANEVARGAVLTPQLLAREAASRQVSYDAEAPPVAAASADGSGAPPAQAAAASSVLPAIAGGEWIGPVQVATFDPTNLWEKIDGRAEAYLAYDFRRMTFGTYRAKAKATDIIDAFVYEMGDVTKTFGIYQSERSANATSVSIGTDGYSSASGLFFCKGRAYVQLIGGEEATLTAEQFMQVGLAIAAVIPDEGGGENWADKLLPAEGRVADSMEFLTQDVFSLDFLRDVFSVRYLDGDSETVVFIHRAADAATAAELFRKYIESINALGGKLAERAENEAGGYVEGDFGGEFDIIFWKGRYFGGANAAPNVEAARSRVQALREATPGL